MTDYTETPEVKTCEKCDSLIVQAVHEFYKQPGGGVEAGRVFACNCTQAWCYEYASEEEVWPEHWPDPVER